MGALQDLHKSANEIKISNYSRSGYMHIRMYVPCCEAVKTLYIFSDLVRYGLIKISFMAGLQSIWDDESL